jgi:predicted CopG family antitoxin
MVDTTIDVSEAVYEALENKQRTGESLDDTLRRILNIGAAKQLETEDSGEAFEASDHYHSQTSMWTVYDQLSDEQKEGETLDETMRRLEGK